MTHSPAVLLPRLPAPSLQWLVAWEQAQDGASPSQDLPRLVGPFPRLLIGCEPTEDKMRVEPQPTGLCGAMFSSQRGNAGAEGQEACHSGVQGRARIKPKGPGCRAMPPAAALNWLTASPHLTSAKSFAAVTWVHSPGSPVSGQATLCLLSVWRA